MALACSTSAFKTDLDGALAEIAALGFSHADVLCNPGWDHLRPEEMAEDWEAAAGRLEGLLSKHSLTPTAFNVAFGKQPYERDDPELNAERLRQAEGIAKAMEAVDLHVASFYPGYKVEEERWEDVFGDWVETWRELQQVAYGIGVEFVLELHMHTVFQDLNQCARLFEELPDLRIAYDPSHFAMQGEQVMRESAGLLDRAAHVHLRDAAPGKMYVPAGRGIVDFPWLLDELRRRDYPGHLAIECLGGSLEPDQVRDDILKLKAIVEEHAGA